MCAERAAVNKRIGTEIKPNEIELEYFGLIVAGMYT